MKKYSTYLSTLVTSIILFAGVPALYAWTAPGPGVIPPNDNVTAPINISPVSQNKTGVLGLGGLAVFGKSLFTDVKGYSLPASKPTMLLGVNGAIGAKEYCDQFGNNCVTTLGGSGVTAVSTSGNGNGSGSGKRSRASLVRSVGVKLPAPQGMSEWPDTLICTFAPGEQYVFDFYGTSGGKLVSYWTQDQIGVYFNFDGTLNVNQSLRGDPKCGSTAKNMKQFCDEGRCIQ